MTGLQTINTVTSKDSMPSNTIPLNPIEDDRMNPIEDDRTDLSAAALERDWADNLFYIQGRTRDNASLHDLYMALAYAVRDRLLQRWLRTTHACRRSGLRVVCYLSAEYLMGPYLGNALLNLGIEAQ